MVWIYSLPILRSLTLPAKKVAAENKVLFEIPVSRVDSISIELFGPGKISLGRVKIRDEKEIEEIIATLRSAKTSIPNHPTEKWTGVLLVESGATSAKLELLGTNSIENGLVLYHVINGWHVQSYRCDELGPIIRKHIAR